jgi:hypothetical protein
LTKQKVELGGLYAIPGADQFGLAKVIYVSKYFRDVILIRLYKKAYAELDGMAQELPAEDADSVLYYTGGGAIKNGTWRCVGGQPVSEKERALTKRVVGGGVWIEDNHIGPASDDEMSSLKQMSVYAYKLVEKAVSRLNV